MIHISIYLFASPAALGMAMFPSFKGKSNNYGSRGSQPDYSQDEFEPSYGPSKEEVYTGGYAQDEAEYRGSGASGDYSSPPPRKRGFFGRVFRGKGGSYGGAGASGSYGNDGSPINEPQRKGLFGNRGGRGGRMKPGCGSVYVDCRNHTINIDGHVSTVDCGKSGKTRSGKGTVGGRHSGPKVPDGLYMNTPGMRGTAKVFHTWGGYRRNGRTPSYPRGTMPMGRNSSEGCVVVNDQVYAKLKSSCRGKPLTIIGSDRSSGRRMASSQSYKKKSRKGRY